MNNGGSNNLSIAESSLQCDIGSVLIGTSPLFRQVLDVVDSVATNDCVVLIEGESGTGKELIARRIHQASSRKNDAFIPVNCSAISESLFESQFYGHLKGAFTGASTDTLGVVRAAEGGTLLLDEVGELPLHLQPKLLRLIQEHELIPVGASRPISVNVRFVVSTNRSLAKSVSEGNFRSDLYHRLNIVRIQIPPLRLRKEDVEPLLDYYLQVFAQRYRMSARVLSPRLRKILTDYDWPGNVRELCSYIERLYAANLPPMPPTYYAWDDGYGSTPKPSAPVPMERMPLHVNGVCSLADAEAQLIRQALEAAHFNRSAAAKMLEIHRSTLLRKMRLHGMDSQ